MVRARMIPRRGDEWTCSSCGNVNFADRKYCNMRKCGASRYDAPDEAIGSSEHHKRRKRASETTDMKGCSQNAVHMVMVTEVH